MRNNAAYLPESPIVYIILPKSIRNRASSHIHVYGLSLSEVDMPYLKHILSIVRSAKWEFSDYNGLNHDKINCFCKTNNIKDYDIINLEDIIDKAQLKIQFPELK